MQRPFVPTLLTACFIAALSSPLSAQTVERVSVATGIGTHVQSIGRDDTTGHLQSRLDAARGRTDVRHTGGHSDAFATIHDRSPQFNGTHRAIGYLTTRRNVDGRDRSSGRETCLFADVPTRALEVTDDDDLALRKL